MVAVIIGIAVLYWFVKAATGLAGDCDPAPVAADISIAVSRLPVVLWILLSDF